MKAYWKNHPALRMVLMLSLIHISIVRADDFQHLIENLFHLPHQCELGAGAVAVVIRASNMEIMVALQIVSQKTDAAFQLSLIHI